MLPTMLTPGTTSATHRKVGRRKINDEEMTARFPAGTLARMRAVLRPRRGEKPAEKMSDIVRDAVEREITRRERSRAKRKPASPRDA